MEYLYGGACLQNGRPTNMDSLLLKSRRIDGIDALLAVVCDGVGSLSEGSYASGTAARMLGEWFDCISEIERIGLKLRDAASAANAQITAEAKRKGIQTASTLSALLLVATAYYIVHVGDSRIYSYDGKSLSLLTSDDVSQSGKLTACIGRTDETVLQYSEGTATDHIFLICSDGLYKRTDLQSMIPRLKAGSRRMVNEAISALMQHAIDQGERDNITLAVVKTVI